MTASYKKQLLKCLHHFRSNTFIQREARLMRDYQDKLARDCAYNRRYMMQFACIAVFVCALSAFAKLHGEDPLPTAALAGINGLVAGFHALKLRAALHHISNATDWPTDLRSIQARTARARLPLRIPMPQT